jgi:acetyltransferase-like isoleucine patch superfamily enzyme
LPDFTSPKALFDAAARARRRFANGVGVPLPVLAQKTVEYALSLATAPVYLWAVNRVGRNVRTIGRPRIENYGTIEIGDGVVLRSALLPLELATNVGGRITIGAESFINYGTAIGAAGDLRIGERVNIAPFVTIFDTTYHDPYDRKRVPPAREVTICDDVFIGAKASIMPGVTIGEGAIVATGAVVTHDVRPFTIVAGVPAKVVEELDPAKFVRYQRAE